MGGDLAPEDGHDKARLRMIDFAKTATEKERKMTLMQGIRLYPKAIAWSILISTCIVMEGYDVCLINNFCKLGAVVNPGHSSVTNGRIGSG